MIILADETPKARTSHRCLECNRIIEPGEKYRRQRNIGEDGPYVWKACLQCARFARDLWGQGVYGWPEDDCYPYLPEVEWSEVTTLGEVWVIRAALYRRKWRRRGELAAYPEVAS